MISLTEPMAYTADAKLYCVKEDWYGGTYRLGGNGADWTPKTLVKPPV